MYCLAYGFLSIRPVIKGSHGPDPKYHPFNIFEVQGCCVQESTASLKLPQNEKKLFVSVIQIIVSCTVHMYVIYFYKLNHKYKPVASNTKLIN